MNSDRYRKGVPPAFPESQPKYLQEELTKLERVSDLFYDDVAKFERDGLQAIAAIQEERTTRANADEALAQIVQTLSASMETGRASTDAMFVEERTARATKDEALAQQITTLAATVETKDTATNAAIEAERTARANADGALAQDIVNLSATVSGNKTTTDAAIETEKTARVTQDTAIAKSVSDLTASMTMGDSALSTRITNEETARVNADGALSQRVTDLSTSLNTKESALSARITNEETARVNADSANAQATQSLSTTVGNHTTTIAQHTESINGLSARWGIRIVNNSRVAGIQLNSNPNGTSSFDIEADALNVFRPGTNERAIYWDGSDFVVRGNIRATSVTTEAVNSLPAEAVVRTVVGNPEVVAQGDHSETAMASSFISYNSENGATERIYNGFSVYIPTGFSVGSDWTTASTKQYLATCTISAGTSKNGGMAGYSEVTVVVGDGIITDPSYGTPVDNQIYLRYTFHPGKVGTGEFIATKFSWKLVRI